MSSEFQIDGKDGAIEPSGVVKTPEWKITLKHLVGGTLWTYIAELLLRGAKQKGSSLEAG